MKRGVYMQFFLTLKSDGNVSFSPIRERDKLGSDVISCLRLPLDLLTVQIVLERLRRQSFSDLWFQRFKRSKQKNVQRETLKILKKLGWGEALAWENRLPSMAADQTRENKQEAVFNQLVMGRQLLPGDLRRLALELKLNNEESIKYAQRNVEQGNAQWIPAVRPQGKGWQCQRCGETDLEEWPGLHGLVAACRSCESIGPCTSLEALYRDQRPLRGPSKISFHPHWVLTEPQRLASEQVLDFIQDVLAEKALLWAACGAGKTEVCFPAAAWALKKGKSVLFAAPRQDVIHDVAPRLERDFPGYPFQVLSGAASIKFQRGGMVLATTHQVLRFWQAFDVIFMDEMDAFPYRGSQALQWGLYHALRHGGKILYLTATPSPEGLKAVEQGKMRLIRLPARHHRTPLPVPIWERSRNSLGSEKLTDRESSLIEALRKQGPVLVFVPKISWLDPGVKCFQGQFPDWKIDGSYSADPDRAIKLKRLQQGEFDLFVSTTILERGITLSGIQVVVWAADHAVFDERALVQMAGRVGRSQESPEGKVIFVSKQRTAAMRSAIQWIEEQNRLALELGLLEGRTERAWKS